MRRIEAVDIRWEDGARDEREGEEGEVEVFHLAATPSKGSKSNCGVNYTNQSFYSFLV
jgi:hypothetical protein